MEGGDRLKTVAVYCRGAVCGSASVQEKADRLEISTQIPDPGDGLYRAVLVCGKGDISLGVMEPKNGTLELRRRPEKNTVSKLGEIQCVQVGCSFSFGKKKAWNKMEDPALLLRDPFLCERLNRCADSRWRRDGDKLALALPIRDNTPFPLEAMFCFASPEWVEGELCAVFRFDGQEQPQMPSGEKSKKR